MAKADERHQWRVDDRCIGCGASVSVAPELIVWDGDRVRFARQPSSVGKYPVFARIGSYLTRRIPSANFCSALRAFSPLQECHFRKLLGCAIIQYPCNPS